MSYIAKIIKEHQDRTFGSAIGGDKTLWEDFFETMEDAEFDACTRYEEFMDKGLQGIVLRIEHIT